MRRQTSLAIREQSVDSKPTSKIKKCKNGHALNGQKKNETRALKQLESNQIKSSCNQSQKQQINQRWFKKLNMISTIVTKSLDIKHRQIYFKFIECVEKQEKIRAKIEYQEQECNKYKIRQFKDLLMRLLEKQEYLIEESNQYSTETVNNVSGALSTNYLIAKECSPKSKFQNLAFGDFNKKSSNLIQEELLKKEMIIKRLFQKIELLKQTALVDSAKNISFSQNIDHLNSKILQNLNNNSKIYQLQQNNKLFKQINENCKNQQDLLRYKYKMLQEDYSHLLQKTSDYHNLKEIKYDYLRLKQISDKYPLLQKKYRQLEQEFQVLVSQKIQLQSDLYKKSNQIKSLQHKINQLVSQLKGKIFQISSDNLMQIKNIQEQIIIKFNEQKDSLNSFILQFITDIINKYENNLRQIKNQLLQQQTNSLQLLNQIKHQKQQLLQMTEPKQVSITSKENIKSPLLSLQSQIYHYQHESYYQQKPLSLFKFQIFKQQQVSKIDEEVQTTRNIQTIIFDIFHSSSQKYTSNQSSQTQVIIKEETSIQTQTDISLQNKQILNKNQKIENSVQTLNQTQKQLLSIFNVIDMIINEQTYFNTNQTSIKFEITHNYSINLINLNLNCQLLQNQEKVENLQKNVNVFQLNQLNIPEQPEQDQTHEILQILERAEDCLLISQTSILRSQINCYRQQIDRLKLQIRQHQKEKEEENVFNFRL